MTLPSLENVKIVALDTETYDPKLTSKGPGFLKGWGSYMIGFSYAIDKGSYGYIPTKHSHGNYEGNWKGWLLELCGDPNRQLIFANARYDIEVLWSEGIEIKAQIYDIQTLDALINENNHSFSLASIADRRSLPSKGTLMIEEALKDKGYLIKNKPDWSRLRDLPVELVASYGELDGALTLAIYKQQLQELARDNLEAVAELESQLIPIFWDMRRQGVNVDLGNAENLNFELQEKHMHLLNAIVEQSGGYRVEPFAADSLARWVRNLGFEPPKTNTWNKNKQAYNDSITNEWLRKQNHILLTQMAEYREGEKIRRDFVDALVLENSVDGKVHPTWFSTRGGSYHSGGEDFQGTRSGRPSCIDPNLTQIPARHPVYGPAVRGLFLPEPGSQWGKFDYSAQEPRITVHYAYELGLNGAAEIYRLYQSNPNTDFHQATADLVKSLAGIDIGRPKAKIINLGLAYGMGKGKLARQLGLQYDAAVELMDAYHQSMRFMKTLLKYCSDCAQKDGYVTTVLGRRRHFDEWEKLDNREPWEAPINDEYEAKQKWGMIKRAGTYKALNAKVQGSAAEQTKTAMVSLYHKGMVPLVQVYDELGYSIYSPDQAQLVKAMMEGVSFFNVPHIVEVKLTDSWSAK